MRQFNPRMKGMSDAVRTAESIALDKIGAKRRRLLGFAKSRHWKATPCSKCTRGMDSFTAKQQIENKREDAPICIPCILGKERKPLNQTQ